MGLNDSTLLGGHICPISTLGLVPAWKYAQKNLEKNKTSDEINNIILILMLFFVAFRCNPSLFASVRVFFHHNNARYLIIIKFMITFVFVLFFLKIEIIDIINLCAWNEDKVGQGLLVTIWYVLNFSIIYYDVSFWYKSINVISTYACTIATPISNIVKRIVGMVDIIEFCMFIMENEDSKVIRRWPATMLADNRIESVIGRMIALIVSITTMKFISGLGVPNGVKWIIILLNLFFHPNIIVEVHIDALKEKLIEIWAVGVKLYGKIAIKFQIIIVRNIIISIDCLCFNFFSIISLTSLEMKIIKLFFRAIFFEIILILFLFIIIIGIVIINQFDDA